MKVNRTLSTIAAALSVACASSGAVTPPPTVTGYTVALKAPLPATASAGSPVTVAFTVTEIESNGTANPAANQSVNVTVTAGNGTVNGSTSATVTTAADGSAALTWVLGATVGPQGLRASAASATPVEVVVTSIALPTLLVNNASCTAGGCRTLELRAFVSKFNVPGQLPTGMGFIGYIRPGQHCITFPPSWTLTINSPSLTTIVTWTPRDSTAINLVAVDSALSHGPANQAQADSIRNALFPFDGYFGTATVGEAPFFVAGDSPGWAVTFPSAPIGGARIVQGTACQP